MVAHRFFDERGRLGARKPVLGLALELRIADEDREHQLAAGHDVLGRDFLGLLLPDQLAERADALDERVAQPRFVRAAIGGRDGVAIPAVRAVAPQRPRDRAFDATRRAGEILACDEEVARRALARADLFAQVIGKAAGELEHRFGRRVVADQFGRALPANLDAREQIRLRARELVQPRGLEAHLGAEDLLVGDEADHRAAPVGCRADMLDRPERLAARETLAVELAVARDLDDRVRRQRIDDADADAVQTARRRIGLAVELAARVQRGQDHFERRLAGKFRMRIDRDAAAIVDDDQPVAPDAARSRSAWRAPRRLRPSHCRALRRRDGDRRARRCRRYTCPVGGGRAPTPRAPRSRRRRNRSAGVWGWRRTGLRTCPCYRTAVAPLPTTA